MIIPTYNINDVPVQDRWHIDTQNEEEANAEQEIIERIAQMSDEEVRDRLEQLLNEVSA